LEELPDSPMALRTVRISCGRVTTNTIILKDTRISMRHFTLRVRACNRGRVVLDLLDQSTNGTWVDGRRVGRGRRVPLSIGQRIVALPAALVGKTGEVGYLLVYDTKGAQCNADCRKCLADTENIPPPLASVKSVPRDIEEDLRCSICTDVLHHCLTLVPCGHNFCAACLAKWRRRSLVCPECRASVRQAVQNVDVDKMADAFLRAHPEAARSLDELAGLDRAICEPEAAALLRWLLRDPTDHPEYVRERCSAPVARARTTPLNVATPSRQTNSRQVRRAGTMSPHQQRHQNYQQQQGRRHSPSSPARNSAVCIIA
jgi:hypothetical protein